MPQPQHSPPFVAIISLIALAIIIALGVSSVAPEKKKADAADAAAQQLSPLDEPTITFVNPRRGAADGAVKIVVFGDYGCSACASLEGTLLDALQRHPNEVTVVWKDLPNPAAHQGSGDAAIAARCAANQGAFWEYHDALFAQGSAFSVDVFVGLASALQLDVGEFTQCLTNTETRPLVERDIEEAVRLRIDATPQLFIGSRRISGAVSADSLEGFIAEALSPKKP